MRMLSEVEQIQIRSATRVVEPLRAAGQVRSVAEAELRRRDFPPLVVAEALAAVGYVRPDGEEEAEPTERFLQLEFERIVVSRFGLSGLAAVLLGIGLWWIDPSEYEYSGAYHPLALIVAGTWLFFRAIPQAPRPHVGPAFVTEAAGAFLMIWWKAEGVPLWLGVGCIVAGMLVRAWASGRAARPR